MSLTEKEQEVIRRLHDFLLYKDLLHTFITEVKENSKRKHSLFLGAVEAPEIINFMLEWTRTAHGHPFWHSINEEWKQVCRSEGCFTVIISDRIAIIDIAYLSIPKDVVNL